MFKLPSDFQWLSPWSPICPADRIGIEEELRREIPSSHVLAGCGVMAIGESANYDDFLFATDCTSKPIAAVHLTWRVESDPAWPLTAVYASLDDWIQAMTVEHAEFVQRFTGDPSDRD